MGLMIFSVATNNPGISESHRSTVTVPGFHHLAFRSMGRALTNALLKSQSSPALLPSATEKAQLVKLRTARLEGKLICSAGGGALMRRSLRQ